ncbi:MAG: MarR family winged helix-turn-helix transcriptional regulator [Candidatus Limnocylindrales bacterium]
MSGATDEPSRALVEQAIDDLSAILRLRTYIAPPAWAETNLTIGQIQLLMKLRRFGPVPMHQIAEWLARRNASATGIVDRLERHGLVERRHPERDRRVVEVVLTAAGTGLIDEILGVRREGFRAVFDALTDDDLADLHGLLGRAVAAGERIAHAESPSSPASALPSDRSRE